MSNGLLSTCRKLAEKLDWIRFFADLAAVTLISIGVGFATAVASSVDRWRDAGWSIGWGGLEPILADRTFLLAVTLAYAIPVERASTDLIRSLPTSSTQNEKGAAVPIHVITIVWSVSTIIIGFLLLEGAPEYAGMLPVEFKALSDSGSKALSRSVSTNLSIAAGLPPLLFLSVFFRSLKGAA